MRTRHVHSWLAGAAIVALAAASALVASPAAAQTTGCRVTYTVASQWPGGFTGNVAVENLGSPINGWQLAWSFTAGQTIDQLWNGSVTQSGAQVTVTNASWNGTIASGGNASFGFNGSWNNSSNPVPSSFALNGVTCTGSTTQPPPPPSSPPAPPPSPPPSSPPPPPTGSLPSSFQWSSSGPLVGPKSDSRNLYAIKDPSVVFHNGRYHIFATTAGSSGWNMVYFNFTDWPQANNATFHYLDQTAIGSGYKAAPHVFYFAPQGLWYLVYQTGNNAAYTTNPDISNPNGWSTPRNFYGSMPQIIQDNIGNGYWVDMWVICDSSNCYLFSTDDNGHLYRSQTSASNFPNGMGNTVIALQDSNRHALFEAPNVYRVQGSNQYLLVVEAIGSDGRRWFRSWTSNAINGSWTPLAASESNPFGRSNNVTFSGTAWTRDISHGEMIRASNDQTLTINPCRMQFLYQGIDPNASGDYVTLPWRLGLLTQTNSTC